MQTDVGRQLDGQRVTASYIYAARYGYSETVLHNDNQIRLSPRDGEGQTVILAQLWTLPQARGVEYRDRFGNRVQRVRVVERHTNLVVATAGQVSLSTEIVPADDVGLGDVDDTPEGLEYVFRSPLVDPDTVSGLALQVASDSGSLLQIVNRVTDWVYRNILYKRGTTDVTTTAVQVVASMEGVCQDKTHLALGMLRSLGVPCRYVSGLLTGPTGETHSWLEFLHPTGIWVGADPTRGVVNPPARDYVKFAVGRDYTDVSPVHGSFLSQGGATECAVIAQVRFEVAESTLDDALQLLEDAFVVGSKDHAR